MTSRDRLAGEYFEWLHSLVCKNNMSRYTSYKRLLLYLHGIDFRIVHHRDLNRSEDGVDMRYRFARSKTDDLQEAEYITQQLARPCSVFEMIAALATHCEEFMDDPSMGDRTPQWFWKMITNLGLSSMTDERFDARYVDKVVDRFLDRNYAPDGRGGLFRIVDCDRDLRDVEIWWQMCWYLNTIT